MDEARRVEKKGRVSGRLRRVLSTKRRTRRVRAKEQQRSERVRLHKALFGHHNTEARVLEIQWDSSSQLQSWAAWLHMTASVPASVEGFTAQTGRKHYVNSWLHVDSIPQ